MPGVEGDAPVTDRHADGRAGSRRRFRRSAKHRSESCRRRTLDRVWRAVSGELPADERRDLVDRMATDPALAEAWRGAQELSRPRRPEAHAKDGLPAMWRPSWLAAAAVLIVGIAVGDRLSAVGVCVTTRFVTRFTTSSSRSCSRTPRCPATHSGFAGRRAAGLALPGDGHDGGSAGAGGRPGSDGAGTDGGRPACSRVSRRAPGCCGR